MAISALAKDGPYFTSGSISFGQLRSTFKPDNLNQNVRASEYRRTTAYTKVAFIPDATENTLISTANNLALSQYRNSIKSLSLTQFGTDVDVRIDTLNWNGNINRNIPKYFYLNGTVGQSSAASSVLLGPSSGTASDTFNLKLVVNGLILALAGSGGGGGAAGDGSGGGKVGTSGSGGGTALIANVTVPPVVFDVVDGISTRNYPVDVIVSESGRVYAGGGGGAGGIGGANGPNGVCSYFSYFWTGSACGSVPSCGTAVYLFNEDTGCCRRRRKKCRARGYRSRCRAQGFYEVRGGYGGGGGTGGTGRGYTTQASSLGGVPGFVGESPFCNYYEIIDGIGYGSPGGVGSFGATGETGGSGGDWGDSGQPATLTSPGRGGNSINCIFRNSVFLSGSLGNANLKGPISNTVT